MADLTSTNQRWVSRAKAEVERLLACPKRGVFGVDLTIKEGTIQDMESVEDLRDLNEPSNAPAAKVLNQLSEVIAVGCRPGWYGVVGVRWGDDGLRSICRRKHRAA